MTRALDLLRRPPAQPLNILRGSVHLGLQARTTRLLLLHKLDPLLHHQCRHGSNRLCCGAIGGLRHDARIRVKGRSDPGFLNGTLHIALRTMADTNAMYLNLQHHAWYLSVPERHNRRRPVNPVQRVPFALVKTPLLIHAKPRTEERQPMRPLPLRLQQRAIRHPALQPDPRPVSYHLKKNNFVLDTALVRRHQRILSRRRRRGRGRRSDGPFGGLLIPRADLGRG